MLKSVTKPCWFDEAGSKMYLAVSQHSDDGDPKGFNMLFQAGAHGSGQLLQHSQGLQHLRQKPKTQVILMSAAPLALGLQ